MKTRSLPSKGLVACSTVLIVFGALLAGTTMPLAGWVPDGIARHLMGAKGCDCVMITTVNNGKCSGTCMANTDSCTGSGTPAWKLNSVTCGAGCKLSANAKAACS